MDQLKGEADKLRRDLVVLVPEDLFWSDIQHEQASLEELQSKMDDIKNQISTKHTAIMKHTTSTKNLLNWDSNLNNQRVNIKAEIKELSGKVTKQQNLEEELEKLEQLIEENNQNIELTDDEVLVQIYRKSANISMPMVEAFKAKIAEIDRIRVEEQSKKEELVRVEDAIETIKNAYQKAKEEMEEETLKSKDLHKNSISLTQQFKDCEKRIFHLENQKRVKFFEMLRHKEKIFTLEYYRQLKEIQLERDNFNSLIPSTLFE